MGIYVFSADYLLTMLDENREETDFGMHLLPRAIGRDNVFAYPFYGYWRDVGTIQSYWEANMDVIRPDSGLTPQQWGVRPNPYAEGFASDRTPARFRAGCKVGNSMVSAGCVIEGTVVNSILSPGVRVAAGAVVRDSIIGDDSVIGEKASVDLAILDKRVRVGAGAVVGSGSDRTTANRQYPKHLYTGISLIGKGVELPEKMVVGRNCIVHPWTEKDSYDSDRLESGGTI